MGELPTDNLYKFMALAGLACAFVSIYFPYRYRQRFLERLDEIDMLNQVLAVDVEYHKRRVRWLQAKLGEAEARDETSHGVGPLRETLPSTFERDADDLDKEVTELERRQAQTRVRITAMKRMNHEVRILNLCMVIGVTVGLAVASIGFTLWYVKSQRYQDAAAAASRG